MSNSYGLQPRPTHMDTHLETREKLARHAPASAAFVPVVGRVPCTIPQIYQLKLVQIVRIGLRGPRAPLSTRHARIDAGTRDAARENSRDREPPTTRAPLYYAFY